ncbi:MAG: DUF2270 domain-containing protein [bacterium]
MSASGTAQQTRDDHKTASDGEPVWTFRGYEMRPSEFNTAMVHYYRAEIQRSNIWRQRLDNTTNWAVVTAGAALSFALSDPAHHGSVLILNTLLITIFLWIEARRYRYYELWAYRTRLMETDFFANMLVPPFAPLPDWAERLSDTLQSPEFPISMWEAFGRRFRRNYMWIFVVLALAWLLKCFIHPTFATSWSDFVSRSAIGPIHGYVIFLIGFIFNMLLFLVGLGTAGLQQASGEVLPKSGDIPILRSVWRALEVKDKEASPGSTRTAARRRLAHWRQHRRQNLLCLIVTTKPRVIAERIMRDRNRGVTALYGMGMHSQQEREVLMVAANVHEMPGIKSTVKAEDENAFVIVMPAQEVLGAGFQPLEL